jgi:hypothetical protein
MTATDIEAFFAGGATAAKFEDKQYGQVIGGEITAEPAMRQQRDYTTGEPITYPDGNPAMQMVVTVQAQPATGDDDGQRALYIKGQMKQAVGDALRKAGATAPRKGGKLWIKYVEDKPVTLQNGRPGNPQKIYAAKYEPPVAAQNAGFFADAEPVATQYAGPGTPAGIDPVQWAVMTTEQREQLRRALGGQAAPSAATFTDEPPF